MRRTTRVVTALVALVALYASLVGPRAVALATLGTPGQRLVGWLVLLVPVVAVGYVVLDLRLEQAIGRMRIVLVDEGAVPDDDRDSGIDPGRARAWSERLEARTVAAPDDWRAWFHLARLHALSGERRRSRQAYGEAARLFRAHR